MNVKDFTQPEIDYLISKCNFVNMELPLFELRAKGVPLEEIAEILDVSIGTVKYVSQKVNKKIIKVL